ncbi:MAG: hypothetical protein AAF710_06960 [Planctomycetota bacterium]
MALRPPTYLDSDDAAPDLQRGVPGVDWHRDAAAEAEPARLRKANMPSDDAESYVLYVALIFAIALILRLLVVMMGPMFDVENAYTTLTPVQLELAENLAEQQTFGLAAPPEGTLAAEIETIRAARGEQATVGETGLVPDFHHAPGYPAVLSLFTFTGLSLKWLLVAQCVVGALCVPLVYGVGVGLVGRKAPAALAAALVALHPAMILAPSTLAADAVVVVLVLAGLYGVARAETRGFRGAFGGGLSLGVASLFAPAMLWLSPIAAGWMVLGERRVRSAMLAAVMLLGTAVPAGLWMTRNTDQGFGPWITTGPAFDRLFGTLATAQDPLAGPHAYDTKQKLLGEFRTYVNSADHAETPTLELLETHSRDRLSADLVGTLQTAVPATAPKLGLDHSLDLAFARLGLTYEPAGYAAAWLGESIDPAATPDPVTEWVVNGWVGLNAALVVAAAVGGVLMLWRRRWAGLVLMLMVGGYFVYLGTAGPSETLRLPLLGLQALMVTAILAPGPLKVRKPKAKKVRKAERLDDGPSQHSPLATEASLRPAAAGTSGAVSRPVMGSGDISMKDAIHPILRGAPDEPRDAAPAEEPDEPATPAVDLPEPEPVRPLMMGGGRPI